MADHVSIGRAIKLGRTRRGLSQGELAERCGISLSYLSLLERDKRDPSFSMVVKLAQGLDLPLVYLAFLACDLSHLDPILAEKLSYAALKALESPDPRLE